MENFLDWRKLVARREKTMEYFQWEYFKGPWGPAHTTLADVNGKIIGQYSTLPYEAFYFGEKMKASLSFDTGTHPDYRRQGIFKTIGDYHFREEGKQDIHFSTGFPNENFWPGGKKFNWHGLCPIPLYVNNIISELEFGKMSKYDIIEIEKFDEEFKGFSKNFKEDIPIYLDRTKEYLNWRFVEKPSLEDPKHRYNYSKYKIYDKTGEMVSYFVTKKYHEEKNTFIHLIDFLSPNNKDIFQAIFHFLIGKAKTQNINAISLFLNRYHALREFLNNFGFEYLNTNRVYIVRVNNNILDKEILFEEKNHFFTMGDSDVI